MDNIEGLNEKFDAQAIERIFQEATLKGHFKLNTMDKHSSTYIEKARIFKHTLVFDSLCRAMALKISRLPITIELVAGPGTFGAVIAYLVARFLEEQYHLNPANRIRKVEAIFTDKNEEGQQHLRPGFQEGLAGKKILVVDDIGATGRNIKAIIKELVTLYHCQLGAIGIWCNRGGLTSNDFYGYPLVSLANLQMESWLPSVCTLCKQGIPITATH